MTPSGSRGQNPPPAGRPGSTAGSQPASGANRPPDAGSGREVRDPRTGQFRTAPPVARPPAARQRQPVDIATRLDGQRGWLKELDDSLRKRSIVALVLTCLAVGVGAAALYISITKNADGDRITALEKRITALEDATGGGAAGSTVPTVPPTGVTPPAGTLPGSGTTTPGTGTTPPAGTTGATGTTLPTLPGE